MGGPVRGAESAAFAIAFLLNLCIGLAHSPECMVRIVSPAAGDRRRWILSQLIDDLKGRHAGKVREPLSLGGDWQSWEPFPTLETRMSRMQWRTGGRRDRA